MGTLLFQRNRYRCLIVSLNRYGLCTCLNGFLITHNTNDAFDYGVQYNYSRHQTNDDERFLLFAKHIRGALLLHRMQIMALYTVCKSSRFFIPDDEKQS